MTAEEDANIRRIEADRKKREAWLLLLLLGFGSRALLHSRSAIRVGSDPVQAAADTIVGGPHIDGESLAARAIPILADAYYTGMWRAGKMAGVVLDIPQDAPPPPSVIDAARELERRTAEAVRRVVRAAMEESMQQQARTRAFLLNTSAAFAAAGLTVENPYGFAMAAEREVVTAHGGGMWNGFWTPAVANVVTGFQHHSILDSRTTDICRERDGLILPSSHPYWLQNIPSLHWHCRSCVLATFGQQDWSTQLPVTQPDPGFGRAPWTLFGIPVGRAA